MTSEGDAGDWFKPWWDAYVDIAPNAERALALLRPSGGVCGMDHVAIRTYATPRLEMRRLESVIERAGYVKTGTYDFKEKRLRAASYSHRSSPLPRIFVSELIVNTFGNEVQEIIERCDARQEHDAADLLWNPRCSWRSISSDEFEVLLAESEYAAWVGAYGLRVNHFTVGFEQLSGYHSLGEVNRHLQENGFRLNGGKQAIQGSEGGLFEQSSTVAELVDWTFGDGEVRRVRSCYVEFARRYQDKSGLLFDGFVTSHADNIFESTDMKRSDLLK